MAAVQATPAMQQQGSHAGGMVNSALPHGMTKEQVQQIYKEYQQMKQEGVPETNPKMAHARGILQSIQQKTELLKRQNAHRQMQMQMQMKAQQHAASQQNGGATPQAQVNGAAMTTPASALDTSGEKSTQQAQRPTSMANSAGQTIASPVAGATASQSDAAGKHAFSKDQLATLRAQLSAFSALQKNLPIPTEIQERIFSSKQDTKPPALAEGIDAAAKMLDNSAKATATSSKPSQESHRGGGSMHKFENFTDPHNLLLKRISYADHVQRINRPLIPSIMPIGVDPDRVREERETLVYNRVQARKQELAKLSANIGAWDTSKSEMPEDNTNIKLRNLIEFKMLTLLPKQREMRQKIGKEMALSDNLSVTANRSMYRRGKKQSLREARITEKLEKQQRDAAETKEKNKHLDFVRSITQHAEDIRQSAHQHKARVQRLGRLMMTTHANIEKEEQKRIERTAKQRLQALKANDEETYLKLLGQAKDSRISHLLKQTDGFLNQLADSVKAQQRSSAGRYGADVAAEEAEEADDADSEDETKTKVDYYDVAHRVKEEITKQSSNLVGGTLKEYQIKGLQWMISLYNNKLNGILADEMGLGKTIQTISLVTYLIEKKHQHGPFLVIVPLSTLTNWNNEFEKWAPSVQRIVYKGPPAQRKNQQQQIRYGNFQVLLTTYEFIIKDRPVLSKVKWLHMIVDEGHRMKNAGSKLSSTISQYYHSRYRIILTGTPLQNNLPELWALLNFVLPNIFKSVKSFEEWFNTPFANTGGQDKMDLNEEEKLLVIRRLHKVLRPFLLRRLKKDVEKDLPDKQERVIKCNMSALQQKIYSQLLNHNKIMVSDASGKKTGMRGLSNMLMQLRKLCNHPFVFDDVETQMNPSKVTDDMIWRAAGKFELLDRVLPKFKASGHRVLMFFQMTQIMNIMEDFLRLRGMPYLRLDGSTKSDDRSELLNLFNAPDSPYFCFLLSTRAGGLGLNLQTADTVIIYDSDWNPHQDLQAQDRAHRIGQKNEVRILRLITSNSVEEKILERAQYKLDMDGKVIQAGKFDNKSTNEERDEMLRIMMETAEAADGNMDEDEMDDDDLNLLMMRNDDELELFQKMDQDRIKTSKYGPDKKLPRLLGESELPDIYLEDANPVADEVEFNYGRGARERGNVMYTDGLSDEQWLALQRVDAEEADNDANDLGSARKQVRRRADKKEARLRDEHDLGDSPPASRGTSDSPEPTPKKRGRKLDKVEKRKADEVSLDGFTEPPKKRGRTKGTTDTLSKGDRETLQTILDNVHDSLQDLEEESTDPNLPNRDIIVPFLNLPPKNDYPDYYLLIKNPIAMKQIENKINKKQYQSLKQFRQDVGLLCSNCRQYNEDGSILYNDANLIERACLDKLREETTKHPEWQDYDESGDGASTRNISSVGTPQPSQRSGIKLKLGGARTNGSSSRAGTETASGAFSDDG